MKKQYKQALAIILVILAFYEVGILLLIIQSESMALFFAWVLGQFPVFWTCYKIALLAEEEVQNED